MSIHVSPDLEERIREKVESGQYDDPSDVIRAAMRLLDTRDRKLQELRELVAEGLAAAERGEVDELTPELMAKIDREADEMIRLGIPPDPHVCP
jgi:antitoxin ParD1/3/4